MCTCLHSLSFFFFISLCVFFYRCFSILSSSFSCFFFVLSKGVISCRFVSTSVSSSLSSSGRCSAHRFSILSVYVGLSGCCLADVTVRPPFHIFPASPSMCLFVVRPSSVQSVQIRLPLSFRSFPSATATSSSRLNLSGRFSAIPASPTTPANALLPSVIPAESGPAALVDDGQETALLRESSLPTGGLRRLQPSTTLR